ncbi:MAG: YigZ family protein [Rudaea sp.]
MAARFGLIAAAQLAQEIRNSKFVANATAVACEESATEFLRQISDPDATHNCWAWRIGQRYRFSDDGEPSGTAGKPILLAIDGQTMDNIMVVVTRWFGGIKLGAGGLMRAYGGCASECLRQADKSELIDTTLVEFAVEFPVLARLRVRLHALDAGIEAEDFCDSGAKLRVSVPCANLSELHLLLADLTRGQCDIRRIDSD